MTKQQKAHARQRARQIIWFNPPHSKNVTSETAKSFLFLLNKTPPQIQQATQNRQQKYSKSELWLY